MNMNQESIIKLNDIYISESRRNEVLIVSKELGTWLVVNKKYRDILENIGSGKKCKNIKTLTPKMLEILFIKGIISIDGKKNYPAVGLCETIIKENIIPNLCILHVSNFCNLNCRYCYAHTEDTTIETMSIETMKKAIDRFLELNKENIKIEFHGGEPLLQYKTIREGCKYAMHLAEKYGKKVEFSMQSNLTFLNEECLEFLKKFRVQLRISLDGPKEINDYFRKDASGNGTFDRIVSNLKKLDKNDIHPEVVAVITKKNINKLIEMTKLFLELHLTAFRFIPFWSQGRGNSIDNEEVPQEELFSKYFELLDWIMKYNSTIVDENKRIKLYTLSKEIETLTSFRRSYMCLRCPCGAGMNMVDVSVNGDIFPCEEMNEIKEMYIGNIYDGEITTQYKDSEVVQRLISRNPDKIPECSKCQWKRHCQSGCANKNFQKYGTCNSISDKCEYYKKYFEELAWYIHTKGDMITKYLAFTD